MVKKIKKVCFKYFLLTDHHVNLLMFQETPKPMSLFCPVSQHEIKPWRFANAWPVGQERKSLFHKNSEHSKFRTVELSSTALLRSTASEMTLVPEVFFRREERREREKEAPLLSLLSSPLRASLSGSSLRKPLAPRVPVKGIADKKKNKVFPPYF